MPIHKMFLFLLSFSFLRYARYFSEQLMKLFSIGNLDTKSIVIKSYLVILIVFF
jgi:hypothetical protein